MITLYILELLVGAIFDSFDKLYIWKVKNFAIEIRIWKTFVSIRETFKLCTLAKRTFLCREYLLFNFRYGKSRTEWRHFTLSLHKLYSRTNMCFVYVLCGNNSVYHYEATSYTPPRGLGNRSHHYFSKYDCYLCHMA